VVANLVVTRHAVSAVTEPVEVTLSVFLCKSSHLLKFVNYVIWNVVGKPRTSPMLRRPMRSKRIFYLSSGFEPRYRSVSVPEEKYLVLLRHHNRSRRFEVYLLVFGIARHIDAHHPDIVPF